MTTTAHSPLRRRLLLAAAAATCAPAFAAAPAAKTRTAVEVWKEQSCGCCSDWIAILQKSGFDVRVFDTGNTAMRERLGLPAKYGSCHTARIGGYAVEGHVPAKDIRRLLKDKPQAIGLAVPGMPVGSPGMDDPAYGGRRDPYDVLLLTRTGEPRVYASYNKA